MDQKETIVRTVNGTVYACMGVCGKVGWEDGVWECASVCVYFMLCEAFCAAFFIYEKCSLNKD